MTHIIVKNYEHFNRSLPNWDSPKGKYIRSKAQYQNELAKSGMKVVEKFGQTSEPKRKEYVISQKTREIIKEVRQTKDKKGNVRLSDRQIDAMRQMGAIGKKIPTYMGKPSGKGGFYAVDR